MSRSAHRASSRGADLIVVQRVVQQLAAFHLELEKTLACQDQIMVSKVLDIVRLVLAWLRPLICTHILDSLQR